MSLQKLFVIALLTAVLFIAAQAQSQEFREKAWAAYQQKDYNTSAQFYLAAIRAGDQDLNTFYNGACALSLAGKKDEAFDLLEQLLKKGWADARQLAGDADFRNLYEDPRWQSLAGRVAVIEGRQRQFWNGAVFRTPFQPALSEDEKVAGLSKFWSEARFNFANFDLVPALDWDRTYFEFLPRVRQTKSTLEYYQVLMEFCAMLRDAHTNIYLPQELRAELRSRPLLNTRLIENKVLVHRVFDDALRSAGIVPGLEILEISGIPVQEYAEKRIGPFIGSSTKQGRNVDLFDAHLLDGSAKENVEMTFRDAAGKTFSKSVPRVIPKDRAAKLPPTPATEFRVLPGNIGYIALNTFDNEIVVTEFQKAFSEIEKTEALIIDIRENGGGNSGNGWQILTWLTDKPFKTSAWRTRLYRPSFRAWGTPDAWYDGGSGQQQPKGDKLYLRPVVVLLSPRTFSAAEDFAVAFDVMKRGAMIGEPTGGSTGQPLMFQLPGGGMARVCTKRDTYPDGREFVGVGVQPQLSVAPTVADFRAGRDTVLESAITFLKKGKASSATGKKEDE